MNRENTFQETTKPMTYDALVSAAIINNNYAIQSVFDDIPEGFVTAKFLSKQEAEIELKAKKRGYLTSYRIVNHLAIIGIVPFNKGEAYIFNKKLPPALSDDTVTVTANVYETLMDCYVYHSEYISKKLLDSLISEYYKRGGVIYDTYHSFEELELRKERNIRKREYRNDIVFNSIFKHGFREIGKNKWTNGSVIIKQKRTQKSVIGYPYCYSHCDLETSDNNKVLIGSIFGKYYDHINQHSNNSFGIVCHENNRKSYNFAYFEVAFGCS